MSKRICLIAALCYSQLSYALFCPTNFNNIAIGDSIERVQQQCGAPNQQMTKEKQAPGPQQWDYYIVQQPNYGSVRVSIAFKDDKVINISVNGAGITQTATCKDPIKVGFTSEEVEKACGKPSFVTDNVAPDQSGAQPKKITTWIYNTTPPITLIFEDGHLKERR